MRLLIIGAGREQVPAYEKARQLGLRVVGTDMNPEAPGFAHADDALLASTRDAEGTLASVAEYSGRHRIDGVMTIANDVPLTVAAVAQHLRLPGIPVSAARCASNKCLMKRCFDRQEVATPAWVELNHADELVPAMSRFGFPSILKPSDGRGARGVLLLDAQTDLRWAWEHAVQASDNKILILEKFIAGPQLSVEGVFVEGHYYPVGFADRNYDDLSQRRPYVVEDGGEIPSRFEARLLRDIGELIELGARSMGISWGSVKGDIVLHDGQPMVIELAARLSGNYLATHHIPMAYGVDLVSVMIDLALGRAVDTRRLSPTERTYLGVRYFFPPPGRVEDIRGVEEVRRRDYVRMLDIYLRVGDRQGTIDKHGARAGVIICAGPDYETARQRVERCAREIEFVVS